MSPVTNAESLKQRTKDFALQVIRLCRTLPRSQEGGIIRRQLMRSATSVAANYRAVCRARSAQDFIAKLSIVLEEADESLFWIELLVDAEVASPDRTRALRAEANELVAIFVSSIRTAKANKNLQSEI